MKTMKKALALLMVAAMVMSLLCVSAFAADVDVSSHTFEAYQIFSGTQATDGGALGNISWGTGVDGDALLTDLKTDTTLGSDFASCTTAAQVAAVVDGYENNSAKAVAFSRLVDANKTSTKTTISNNTISTPGYYLIVDITNLSGTNNAKNLSLLAVSNTVTITSKTSVPTVEKKVQDTNDSVANSTTGWQDSADYDIGDNVPFQLTATMGDLSSYEHYYVEFHDTLSSGLTYQSISSVKVGETTLTTSQYSATCTNGKLSVVINDVKAYGATEGTKVVVEYTAQLNSNAVVGSAGNPNTVYLEYSNNPNNTGDGTGKPTTPSGKEDNPDTPEDESKTPDTGKTPEDENIVFTYKVVANKVDSDGQPLSGAKFELFKDVNGTYTSLGEVEQTIVYEKDSEGKDTTTVAGYTFAWTGLDDGTYKIVETQTPAGYNTIDPQLFTVSATHDETADTPALTELSGDAVTGSVITLSADQTAGTVSTDIENQAGSTLPTTGGVGTTLFYVFGAILVCFAGVLLITKKRMGAHE